MIALLVAELRLQVRGGFWAVYAAVAAIYLAVLWSVPDAARVRLAPVVVFSDPSVLALFAAGALVHLERREGVHRALAHGPLSVHPWIAAKVVALTLLATVTAGVVAVGAVPAVHVGWLGLAVVPTSVVCVLVGIAVVSRVSTFNRYLAVVAATTMPLAAPFAELVLDQRIAGLGWLPTGAAVHLLRIAFGAAWEPWAVAGDLVVLAGWGAAAWALAARWTRRYLWVQAPAGVW